MRMKTDARVCSFCHKSENAVAQLFGAPGDYSPRAYICNECISVCNRAVTQERPSSPPVLALRSALANRFFMLVKSWLDLESQGEDTSEILMELKTMARELIAEDTADREAD